MVPKNRALTVKFPDLEVNASDVNIGDLHPFRYMYAMKHAIFLMLYIYICHSDVYYVNKFPCLEVYCNTRSIINHPSSHLHLFHVHLFISLFSCCSLFCCTRASQEDSHMAMRCPHYTFTIIILINFKL